MISLPDRAASLRQLKEFIPIAPAYARTRNFVVPGHAAVSRLSPAIRHRLILEDEVAAAVLEVHPLSRVEKFIQEIYWRRYWKSWLSLRPDVWRDYQKNLTRLLAKDGHDLLEKAARGRMGNEVIDYFCRELVDTGYLHNHARMWFAAWWVHEARLPWELGAEFFLRHLLDGDPASNTLSWRWVAGLHTPGKTYLARRSNLEKYLAPELASALQAGLPVFENPSPHLPVAIPAAAITRPALKPSSFNPALPLGLWIHEEDLSPESSPAGTLDLTAVLVAGNTAAWRDFSPMKREWLDSALSDASRRAANHWRKPVTCATTLGLVEQLTSWALDHQIQQVITLRPDVGALADALDEVESRLRSSGIQLLMFDRPRDLELRPLATGGFFQFWEKLRKRGLIPEAVPSQYRLDL